MGAGQHHGVWRQSWQRHDFGEAGGAKVSTLPSMPWAKGWFHRAIIQRGAAVRVRTGDGVLALTECILRHLGSAGATVAALHEVPVEHLQAALGASTWPLFDRYPFGPVVDGDVVPAQPFDPEASPVTAEVPLIIGDLKDRSANFLAVVDRDWDRTLTEDEMHQRIAAIAGPRADDAVAL